MTLSQLRALLAVEEHGSLLAAARSLGISRNTASQLLRALEEHCASQLLIRTPQGTRLTAMGEEVAVSARQILSLAHDLEERVQRRRGFSGPLRIHLPVSLPVMLNTIAFRLIAQHLPEAEIAVQTFADPEAHCSENVHLRLQFDPIPPDGPFRTFLISTVPVRLVASPGYLAAHGPIRTLEALAAHRLLVWRTATGEAHRLPLRDGSWIDARPALHTTNGPLLRAMAAQGEGVALVPCPREDLTPPWQVLEKILPEQVGCEASLRALIPERLVGLAVTRSLIDITRQLSLLYSAGELVWRQER